jgi:hypothetical protein
MSESLVSGQSDIDEDCVLPDNLSSDDKSQSERFSQGKDDSFVISASKLSRKPAT